MKKKEVVEEVVQTELPLEETKETKKVKGIAEIKTLDERKAELIEEGKKNGFITFEKLADALKGLELDADSLDGFCFCIFFINI